MKKILLLSLVFSTQAFANFSGTWEGQGKITLNNDKSSEPNKAFCSHIGLSINQSESFISLRPMNIDCSPYKVNIKAMTFVVHNHELFLNKQRVGEIHPNYLEVDFEFPHSEIYQARSSKLYIQRKGSRFDYFYVIKDRFEDTIFSLNSELILKY
jgi:hypothetical protein